MIKRLLTRMTIVASSVAMVLGLAIASWVAMPVTAANALAPACNCDAQAEECITNAYNNFECCSPAAPVASDTADVAIPACNTYTGPTTPSAMMAGGNPGAACLEQVQGAVSRCSIRYFICEASCGLGQGRVPRGRLK